MKDISEFTKTLDLLRHQFDEIKRRYDAHAAFKISMQNNYSHFVSLQEIIKQKKCCDSEDIEISTYPFFISREFARCIHVRCNNCGTVWVPDLGFDLDYYYKNIYAKQIQPFRKTLPFYQEDNPFFETSTFLRMKNRAIKHLSLLEDAPDKSLLELGPGVGIALHLSCSSVKYAYELDRSVEQILQKECKCKMVDIFKDDFQVDAILASHFLEHLFMGNIQHLLDQCFNKLNSGGYFVVEVPRGGEAIYNMKTNNDRGRIMYEPHTISFSTLGLINILNQSGFIVKKVTHDVLFLNKNPKPLIENFRDTSLVAVCVKP